MNPLLKAKLAAYAGIGLGKASKFLGKGLLGMGIVGGVALLALGAAPLLAGLIALPFLAYGTTNYFGGKAFDKAGTETNKALDKPKSIFKDVLGVVLGVGLDKGTERDSSGKDGGRSSGAALSIGATLLEMVGAKGTSKAEAAQAAHGGVLEGLRATLGSLEGQQRDTSAKLGELFDRMGISTETPGQEASGPTLLSSLDMAGKAHQAATDLGATMKTPGGVVGQALGLGKSAASDVTSTPGLEKATLA